MGFINDVRKYITSSAVMANGQKTFLAVVEGGSSKKTNFTIRIAAPMVRVWDRISKNDEKKNARQPSRVRGVPVFDNVIKQQNLVEQQSTDGTYGQSVKKKVSVNPTLSTVPEEDVDNLSNLTDDGISLGSSEYFDDDTRAEVGIDEQVGRSPGDDISVISFDDEEWAARSFPLSSIKKVGIVQRVKNVFGRVVDFFVSPFKSKQTAPTSTMIDTHLGLVMSDDNDISSDRRRDHSTEPQQHTAGELPAATLGISTYVEGIDTEPQQHTTARELPAATLV